MRLDEFRKANTLSQRELARGLSEALGRPVRHQTVSRWERTGEVPDDVVRALRLDELPPPPADPSPEPEVGGGEQEPSPVDADDGGSPERERTPKRPPVALPTAATLEGRIREFYETLGGVIAFVEPYDGTVIASVAPRAAKAWVKLAEVNPGVARVWNVLTGGGPWAGVIAVHVPMVIAVATHHGLVPELRLVPAPPPSPAAAHDGDLGDDRAEGRVDGADRPAAA